MKTIGEQAREFREGKGWNSAEMAKAVGTSRQNLESLEETGNRIPKYLGALASVMGVSVDEMLAIAELAPAGRPASDGMNYIESPSPGVPVVGTAMLGDGGNFCDLDYPAGHGDGRIDWPSRDPNAYALRCKGESMKPRIRHGEFVVIEPNHQVVPGDEVLVKSKDGRVMVKQLAYIRDGMVYLDSVNESVARISIPQEQIEHCHYVAGIAKSAMWRAD